MLQFSKILTPLTPKHFVIDYDMYRNEINGCNKCKDIDRLYRDIWFDCYYYTEQSKMNIYGKNFDISLVIKYFPDYFSDIERFNVDIVKLIKDIPMNDLIELCMYHSIWLHCFYHEMFRIPGLILQNYDDMSQPDHVDSKNCLALLIKYKIESRHELMGEIRSFSYNYPIRKNGVYGYKYGKAKIRFDLLKTN